MIDSTRPLADTTYCYVSTGGFGGVWRTVKQGRSLAEAGARVIVVGYEGPVPAVLRAPPFEPEVIAIPTAEPVRYWASRHRVWLMRVALNLTVNRFANAIKQRAETRARGPAAQAGARCHGPLVEAVASTGADIVQAVDLTALDVAYVAAERIGARVVYASHEYWPGFVRNPDFAIHEKAASALLAVERKRIGKVDLVTVTSDAMGERLAQRYGIPRPLTILNSPAVRADLAAPVSLPVRLVFHGGLSADRNIDGLIRAMSHLSDRATLAIHGFGRTVDAGALQDLIDELGLASVVRLHGPFEYEFVVDLLRDYDVGVMVNEIVEENFDVTLPNKVFDCMCAGLAIAMTGSTAVRALLDEVPYGITVDPSSPEIIARDLGALVDDPERIMRMKQAAVEAAPRYWWPEQGRKLVAAFEDMLGPE